MKVVVRRDDQALPVVWQVGGADAHSRDKLLTWLDGCKADLHDQLRAEGAVLIRGLSAIDRASGLEDLIDVLGTRAPDYVGGSTPRQRLSASVYTATELSASYSIPLHQEMAYLSQMPSKIAFFCERAADSRGETTIADARDVTRALDPEVLRQFTGRRLRIRRVLPPCGSLHLASGISRPWQDVFQTEDASLALRTAEARGWSAALRDDGAFELSHEALPAMRSHPQGNELVWCNQAHLFDVRSLIRWAHVDKRHTQEKFIQRQQQRAPTWLPCVTFDDGSPIPDATIDHVFDTLSHAERPHAWQRGDLLLLDNLLYMHGRRPFAGQRRILTSLFA